VPLADDVSTALALRTSQPIAMSAMELAS